MESTCSLRREPMRPTHRETVVRKALFTVLTLCLIISTARSNGFHEYPAEMGLITPSDLCTVYPHSVPTYNSFSNSASITQNVSTTVVDDALGFGSTSESHWRAYVAESEDFVVNSLTMASWSSGTVQVFIYSYAGEIGATELNVNLMTLLGQSPQTAVTGNAGADITFDVSMGTPVLIPAGTKFVVEQRKVTGGSFLFANNYAGSTHPSYISNQTNPVPKSYGSLGFGSQHLIQKLNGYYPQEGSVISVYCDSVALSGTLTKNQSATGVSASVPYSGGNGGTHDGQTITSTGVTGLTATLGAGSFNNGSGSLIYNITGTPVGSGTASFALNVGGQNCILNVNVAEPVCRAKVSSTEYKNFMCHNLGAANTSADPFTPSWEINGGYWQWGRAAQAASGPSGPDAGGANVEASSWDASLAASGSWIESAKTVNDPCPNGYRVPTRTQWNNVIANNTASRQGTWSNSSTNYSSGISLGSELFLPAAGLRLTHNGYLVDRGNSGNYWSGTEESSDRSFILFFHNTVLYTSGSGKSYGYPVRCMEYPGTVGSLACGSSVVSGTLTAGLVSTGVSVAVSYTDGNGSTYPAQTVNSAGVEGLTASLVAGSFAVGSGTIVYNITGIPSGAGTATFALYVGGQSCLLNVNVSELVCRAKVSSTEYRNFMCHNLGAANTSADPFTPSWEINGGYWQWGRAAQAAAGPTGPDASQANDGPVTGWNGSVPPDGALTDGIKTSNDPCPSGYRVPTRTQWEDILLNNSTYDIGSWNYSSTNYDSGKKIGNELVLPAAGLRFSSNSGAVANRGTTGNYLSSTQYDWYYAWYLYITNSGSGNPRTEFSDKHHGYSVRCIEYTEPEGAITSLYCDNTVFSGSLVDNQNTSGISASVPYSGGNGGTHDGQTITSTGVTGLTATLGAGSFNNGSGSLVYNITGTPAGSGTASFELNIGGQLCSLNMPVVDQTIMVTETSGNLVNDAAICSGDQVTLSVNYGYNQVTGFTGDYAPGLWVATVQNGSLTATGSTVTLTSANADPLVSGAEDTQYCITTSTEAYLSFDWSYSTSDVSALPDYDPLFYSVNGAITQLPEGLGAEMQSGVVQVMVPAEGEFCFIQSTADNANGSATTVISNFSASSGYTAAYWNTGESASSITVFPTSSQTYSVTLTDPMGTTSTASVDITVNEVPGVYISLSEYSGLWNDGAVCMDGNSVTLWVSHNNYIPGDYSYEWNNGVLDSWQLTYPSATTSYTVTVSDVQTGCAAVAETSITVVDIPQVYINVTDSSGNTPNDGVVCQGDSLTLDLTGSNNQGIYWYNEFGWYVGDGTQHTAIPASSGTYSAYIALDMGCSVYAYQNVTVNPLPVPVISYTDENGLSNGTICTGGSAELSVSPSFNNYVWSTTPSIFTQNLTVYPAAGTDYSVTVNDENGCFNSASVNIPVSDYSDIVLVCQDSSASCNNVTVCGGAVAEPVRYSIFGATGAQVLGLPPGFYTSLDGGILTIYGSSYSSGTYNYIVTLTGACQTMNASGTITVLPYVSTPEIHVSENSGKPNDGLICGNDPVELTVLNPEGRVNEFAGDFAPDNWTQNTLHGSVIHNQNSVTLVSGSGFPDTNAPEEVTSCFVSSGVVNIAFNWQYESTDATPLFDPFGYTVDGFFYPLSADYGSVSQTGSKSVWLQAGQEFCLSQRTIDNDDAAATSVVSNFTASFAYPSLMWNTGETDPVIVVAPSSTTNYDVTVTAQGGCSATAAAVVSLDETEVPAILFTDQSGIAANDGAICIGDSVTLTVINPANTLSDFTGTFSHSNWVTDKCFGVSGDAGDVTIAPGNAYLVDSTTEFVLTSFAAWQAGAVWNNGKLNLGSDWKVSFDLYLGDSDSGADGMAFVLQDYGVSTPPSSGAGMGYSDLYNAVAVEFDTWENGLPFDSPSDHISINRNNLTNIAAGPVALDNLEDGVYHHAEITWQAQTKTMSVSLDGVERLVHSEDFAATVFGDNNELFFGITASTGLAANVHKFKNMTVEAGCTAVSVGGAVIQGGQGKVTLISGDDGASGETKYCITPDQPVSISFNWNYNSLDVLADYDPFNYTIDAVALNTNWSGATVQAGTASVFVPANSEFCFIQSTIDGSGGAASTDITNFTATYAHPYLAWENNTSSSSRTIYPTSTNTYSVTVSGNNGCVHTASVTVPVNVPQQSAVLIYETSGSTNNDGLLCSGDAVTLVATEGTSYLWSNGSVSGSVTDVPFATSFYEVSVTDINGCVSVAGSSVIVSQTPDIAISATDISGIAVNDAVVCAGDGVNLQLELGNFEIQDLLSYTWNTGDSSTSIGVSPESTTVYTVTATTFDGCVGVASDTVVVNPLPVPVINVTDNSGAIPNDGTVCNGDEVTLSTTEGFAFYVWNTTPNNFNSSVTVGLYGASTYSVTVGDENGCQGSSSVELNTHTVALSCPADATFATQQDLCGAEVFYSVLLSNDYCSSYMLEQEGGLPSGNLFPAGTTIQSYAVYDQFENLIDRCQFSVTIEDLVAPAIICSNLSVQLSSGNSSTATVTALQLLASAADNCSLPTVSPTSFIFTEANIGANIVILTASDAAGNTSTCSATVTVGNMLAPVISGDTTICPGGTAILSVLSGTAWNWSTGAASVSIEVSPEVTTTYGVTITDEDGNTGTASVVVTVFGWSQPDLQIAGGTSVCPGGNTVLSVNSGDSFVWSTGETSSSISVSPVVPTTYQITVTEGVCQRSADVMVTIGSDLPPVALCNNEVIVELVDGQASVSVAEDLAPDSYDYLMTCGFVPSGWAVSTPGNSMASVSVGSIQLSSANDGGFSFGTEARACITSQENVTILLDWHFSTVDVAAHYDPFGYSLDGVFSPLAAEWGPMSQAGKTQVTLQTGQEFCLVQKTTDASSGAATSNVVLKRAVTYMLDEIEFSCSDVGLFPVKVTVTDEGGNQAECLSVITILEKELPELLGCPPATEVSSEGSLCQAAIPDIRGSFFVYDNCNSLVLSQMPEPGGYVGLGNTVITLIATDKSGNSVSCQTELVVSDPESPNFTSCPSDFTISELVCNPVAYYDMPVAVDNCSSVTLTRVEGPYSGSELSPGQNRVRYMAEDAAGNTSECMFSILVIDDQAPVGLCASVTVQLNENGTASTDKTAIGGASYDNCDYLLAGSFASSNWTPSAGAGDVSVSASRIVLESLDDESGSDAETKLCIVSPEDVEFDFAWSYITFDVSPGWDPFGYSIDGIYTGLTVDDAGIELVGNEHIVLQAGQEFCFIQSTIDASGGGAVTEITSLYRPVQLSTNPAGLSYTCSDIGTHSVVLTVRDGSGNTSTCVSTVTVADAISPVYTFCPTDIDVDTEEGLCSTSVSWLEPLLSDNCGIISLVQTAGNQSGSPFPVGSSGIRYVATDAGGNTAVCSFTVSVRDNQLPVALCRNVSVEITNGIAVVTSDMMNDGSYDNCTASLEITPSSVTYGCYDAGSHNVTVYFKDSSGNESSCVSVVTVSKAPLIAEISGNSDICQGNTTELTASGGVSYVWSNGGFTETITVSPAADETYTVTVTNSSGCETTTAVVDVSVHAYPSVMLTVTEQSGLAENDGVICSGSAAILAVTGGGSYLWSNGSTDNQVTVRETGNYVVTVTNEYGCSVTASQYVSVLTFWAPEVQISDNSGIQPNDGRLCPGQWATLTAGGALSYAWNTGATTAAIQASTTGSYKVTLTDNYSCTIEKTADVFVAPLPDATIFGPDAICRGTSVTLNTGSGAAYAWNTGSSAPFITVTPLLVTTYRVTVTSSEGCTSSSSKTIQVNVLPSPEIAGSNAVCIGSSTVLTGQGGVSYLWSNGSTQQFIDVAPVINSVYVVTVTNEYGCTAVKSRLLQVKQLPVAAISGISTICAGGNVTLTATGGATYLWSTGSTSAVMNDVPSQTTDYSVTVTSVDGCTAVANRTVTVNSLPVASILGSDVVCAGGSEVLYASGGAGYLWNTGATTDTLTVTSLGAGTYTVTVTSTQGCTNSTSFGISVLQPPVVSGFSPANGNVGTLVTITGSNFRQGSTVYFNGIPVANVIFSGSGELIAALPFSGNLINVRVETACGLDDLEILPPPSIVSFSPASGPVGTLVTINGQNLDNLQSVEIGGQEAIVISAAQTSAVAYVMPGAVTGAVAVTTPTGTGSSTSSFVVTPTPFPGVQQGAKMTGAGANGNSQQGTAVAVSADGNTAVIGGPFDNSGNGAVWVYTRSNGIWSQQGNKLVGTGASGVSKLGTAVAISADGNTLVAGAPSDNANAGAVWVFVRNGSTWSQQGTKLVGTGSVGTSVMAGTSVSVSADGNTVAVGAPADNSSQGAVWIFSRNSSGSWTQQGTKLAGSGATGAARQGVSVALSADASTLIVGGSQDNVRKGASWIFVNNGTTWVQQGVKLIGTSGNADNYQGCSVAISADGNTALVGGFADNTFRGAAWIFTRSGSNWTQQGSKIVGSGISGAGRFGSSVGLSADGNTAVIGGLADNTNQGAIWTFKRSGNTWYQQGSKFTGSLPAGSAKQGTSVAISATGTTTLFGGPNDNSNKGAFWVFIPGLQFGVEEGENRENELELAEADFILYQNIPNPFIDRTSVRFLLPQDCSVDWLITDISGRIILSMKKDYPAGENVEVFDLNESAGVYWYTIKTPFGVLTRKMLVVNK